MKKRRLIITLLAAVVLLAGWRIVPGMIRQSIPSIYYVTPSMRTYENVVNCNGTLYAVNQSQVVLDQSSLVKEVLVETGDYVSAGQIIASIEAVPGLMNQLPQSLQIDTESIASLLSSYGLTALLEGTGLVSGADLDGLVGEAVGASQATVTSVSAESSQITAPISGVVTAVNLTSNLTASPGEAVVTIVDTSSYKVLVSVGEGDISKIQLGDQAKIRGTAFGGNSYTGKVIKIYPTARKSLSGTTSETVVDVEILLDRADGNIKPGFSAKVEITGGNYYSMVTVPYEAIRQDENNNEYVYTYNDGRLKKTEIVTGTEMINEVEILEGLDENSIVIFNPDDIDREGTMIHIRGRADVD